jgi:hypothetical protein
LTAYDPEAWSELFIGGEGLADRALQALLQLLAVVVVSLIALAPGQSAEALGAELVLVGLLVAGASFALLVEILR